MCNISVDKEMENFFNNLKWLKNHYKLSEKKISEMLGISIEIWKEIENKKNLTDLTVEIFYNIKDNFDINPTDMINKDFSK